MPRDTGIAARLRAAGLDRFGQGVIEVAGWQTRGSADFAPAGSVDHHTAGAPRGNAPSLRVCVEGRPGLPGPLCHVLIGRDLTCYVIAAGRANHAGAGGWDGLVGNRVVYGVEREHVGTAAEAWHPQAHEHAAMVHAALIGWAGIPSRRVCLHREWAPNRKIDTYGLDPHWLRTRVQHHLTAATSGAPLMTDVPIPGYVKAEAVPLGIVRDAPGRWHTPVSKAEHAVMLARTARATARLVADAVRAELARVDSGGGAGPSSAAIKAAVKDAVKDALREGTG